jgi:alpha-L-rhamnosidase
VRVWDQHGKVSAWSPAAHWTTGLMKELDWKAQWISHPASTENIDLTGVKIKRALYRTLNGEVEKDVTAMIEKAVAEKQLPFEVNFSTLGGDPAPNVLKELLVEYTKNGKEMTSRAKDFTKISIPQARIGEASWWFRQEFELSKAADTALATVHCPAYFELHINGQKVGDEVLMPMVTNPKVRTHVVTFDVARYLKPGKNCVGIWTAKGWSDGIALRAQLNLQVAGKPQVVATDATWLTLPSGRSHIGAWAWGDFGGERVEAERHRADWCRAGAATNDWQAAVAATAPAGKAELYAGPFNRIGKKIPAVKVTALANGVHEIDFGTNLTGWVEIKMPNLQAGQLVRMHFSDRLFPDGKQITPAGKIAVHYGSCIGFKRKDGGDNVYQTFKQSSEFVSAGQKNEGFCHQFNYAGFRYVIIEGLPSAPSTESATAMLIETDLPEAGSFLSSDERVNHVHRANAWTLRCLNIGGYPVDCPHRERMGYGDGQVFLEGMMMGYDSNRFFEKWLTDWRETQDPNTGAMPFIAPAFVVTGGGPPWPGAIADGTWQHYLHYGDRKVLEDNFAAIRRYCEHLDQRSPGDILPNNNNGIYALGDWVPPGRGMDTANWPSKEMAEVFCNVYRIRLWQWCGWIAKELGDKTVVELAEKRMAAIRQAVHAAYFDAANHRYVIDEQIYYAFPLMMGVVPEDQREAVMAKFQACLREKNKGLPDTGMLGTKYLVKFLDEAGKDEWILPFYQSADHPSWGYMVENGATTLWEQWNGHWSQIHSCFASADNWLYQGLAGIRPDPTGPGFKKIIIEPAIVGNLQWVKAHHDSPYGRIAAAWKRDGKKVTLEIEIPANTTATVHVPLGGGIKQVGPGKHIITTP